jgi:hypothetical protein
LDTGFLKKVRPNKNLESCSAATKVENRSGAPQRVLSDELKPVLRYRVARRTFSLAHAPSKIWLNAPISGEIVTSPPANI